MLPKESQPAEKLFRASISPSLLLRSQHGLCLVPNYLALSVLIAKAVRVRQHNYSVTTRCSTASVRKPSAAPLLSSWSLSAHVLLMLTECCKLRPTQRRSYYSSRRSPCKSRARMSPPWTPDHSARGLWPDCITSAKTRSSSAMATGLARCIREPAALLRARSSTLL